jgi:hypothetical protein
VPSREIIASLDPRHINPKGQLCSLKCCTATLGLCVSDSKNIRTLSWMCLCLHVELVYSTVHFFLTVAIGNCMVKLVPSVNFCSDENIQTIFGTKLEDFLNYRIDYNSIS